MSEQQHIAEPKSVAVVFEVVGGRPIPRLLTNVTVDGDRYLDARQCAAVFGKTEAYWRGEWEDVWSPFLEVGGSPIFAGEAAGETSDAVRAAAVRATRDIVRAVRFPHLNDDEWRYLLDDCTKRKLDPRRVWVKRQHNEETNRDEVAVITTIAAMRQQAERTGLREHESEPEFCGPDGAWKPGPWPEGERPPYGARVFVRRKDKEIPFAGVAYWKFVATYELDERNDFNATGCWKDGGPHMLGKCAAADAYRKAFPEDEVCGGLYTTEEMRVRAAGSSPRGGATEVREDAGEVFNAGSGEVMPAQVEQPVVRDDPKWAWTLVDETTPDSTRSLIRELLEIGASSVPQAESLIALFKQRLPRLASNHVQAFCAVVLKMVREYPAAYGVELEASSVAAEA
jgi:hypothetical protein